MSKTQALNVNLVFAWPHFLHFFAKCFLLGHFGNLICLSLTTWGWLKNVDLINCWEQIPATFSALDLMYALKNHPNETISKSSPAPVENVTLLFNLVIDDLLPNLIWPLFKATTFPSIFNVLNVKSVV